MMNNAITWSDLALILSQPSIAQLLIESARKRPDDHLEGYMNRYWLKPPAADDLIELPLTPADIYGNSIRIHHILTKDHDRHHHDHPWQFRSIILTGWYREERLDPSGVPMMITRCAGDTYTCSQGEYHRIVEISEEPLYTLCIIGKKLTKWGFLVDGAHVDSHEYLGY